MTFGQSLHLHHRRHNVPAGGVSTVEFMTGCAFLFRSEIVEELGALDPDYFLCCEDLDYSVRIRRVGYRLLFVPESTLKHKVAQSLGGLGSPVYLYYQTRNRLLFMRRHARWYHWPTFMIHFTFSYVIKRFVIFALRRRSIASYRAVIMGIADFLTGRFGRLDRAVEPE